ncbi:TaqI-like C-terminal specificity domain-containing protein [Porphyromonas gingivalis]|uniref:TaqI-like C-terminal specificity domain-containing protein n=1 Tax=Porphyromonas gingivalis TaxID=837 RepID=UPI00097CDF57|nr:TaqI-like C-terminal specificity domain-containing protein [Porphyromonas gingivalis]SJM17841.1 type IIS restriction endonuclease [Porphyromonas gingivalis]
MLTGCNEAFIIDEDKRNEILNNCQSEDERKRTEEIIRPILRGRDIKRYSYDWAGLYIVYIPWHFPLHLDSTITGASEKAEDAFKASYPAVYRYLEGYKDLLTKRNQAETGIRYEWYALQRWGANYWEDFSKPKIIFQEMVQESQFYYDSSAEFFCNDTCRIITGEYLPYLLLILNSHLFFYSVKHFYGGGGLGGHGVRMKHTFFQRFPCLPYDEKIELSIGSNDSQYFEKLLCQRYDLNDEEIQHILND